jgi:hypothetical protein
VVRPSLVGTRPPVPLVTRAHTTYFVPKETEAVTRTSPTPGVPGEPGPTQSSTVLGGAGIDGGLPPSDDARAGDRQAKAAIELDGYKNVRMVEQGPDGTWRARAMRGRTEVTVRVDASGSVSAE